MTEETAPHLTEEEQALESLDVKSDDQGSDPLDEITDIDELRSKTKGYRSAFKKYRAKAKDPKPEVKPLDAKIEIPTDVVRKSDWAKVATEQAKELLEPEVLEVYDDLMKIDLGGFDPLNPKSIASNLKERFAIYRNRNPKKDGKEDTSHLSTTIVQKGTGGDAPKDKSLKIGNSKKPEDWYPKKEA